MMRYDPPHTWHIHLSFSRSTWDTFTIMAEWHRQEARHYKGDHGMVKTHRDAMRHFTKLEARSL